MKESVTFGRWQEKPLEWLIINDDGASLTLWCKQAVTKMTFSESCSAYYAESDVRRFLEGEFYENAFSEEEKARILKTELDCTEYQTYYGAVGVGATAYRREPLCDHVFLLSIREIMKTYALTNEEIYHENAGMLWTRSPESHRSVSLVNCSAEILRGESPYTYESRSYDHTTGMVDSTTFPYFGFATNTSSIVPAVRIKK